MKVGEPEKAWWCFAVPSPLNALCVRLRGYTGCRILWLADNLSCILLRGFGGSLSCWWPANITWIILFISFSIFSGVAYQQLQRVLLFNLFRIYYFLVLKLKWRLINSCQSRRFGNIRFCQRSNMNFVGSVSGTGWFNLKRSCLPFQFILGTGFRSSSSGSGIVGSNSSRWW